MYYNTEIKILQPIKQRKTSDFSDAFSKISLFLAVKVCIFESRFRLATEVSYYYDGKRVFPCLRRVIAGTAAAVETDAAADTIGVFSSAEYNFGKILACPRFVHRQNQQQKNCEYYDSQYLIGCHTGITPQ